MLADLPDSALALLQRVLHAAARFVVDVQRWEMMLVQHCRHFTGFLCASVSHTSCTCWCVCVCVSTGCRGSSLFTARNRTSAVSRHYDIPRMSSFVGLRAFLVAGLKAWNQLPASVHHMDCVVTFKLPLKTILFTEAYSMYPLGKGPAYSGPIRW